jgi:hypothetical protein
MWPQPSAVMLNELNDDRELRPSAGWPTRPVTLCAMWQPALTRPPSTLATRL